MRKCGFFKLVNQCCTSITSTLLFFINILREKISVN